MHISARGWNRNMGAWTLAQQALSEARITHSPSTYSVQMDSVSVNVNRDGDIGFAWGKRLTLTGNFMLKLNFDRSEIIQLFRLAMGDTLSAEILKDTGLSIGDDVIRDRVRGMSVGQLIDLLGSQTSSASEMDPAGLDGEGIDLAFDEIADMNSEWEEGNAA